jgi:hypothetical protein
MRDWRDQQVDKTCGGGQAASQDHCLLNELSAADSPVAIFLQHLFYLFCHVSPPLTLQIFL